MHQVIDTKDAIMVNEESLWLHAQVSEQLPDNPLAYARTGGSLLSAVVDGSFDIACSGSRWPVTLVMQHPPDSEAGTKIGTSGHSPRHVAIELDESFYPRDKEGAVRVDRRMQILISMNVGAVTSGGAACDAHGGFGLSPLHSALSENVALVGLRYSKWDNLVGSVMLSGVHLTNSVDPSSEHLPYVLYTDDEAEAELARASVDFGAYVDAAMVVRDKERVYKRLPNLSKSFTEAPIGYTTLDSIMHTNTGLSADQLEEVLRIMVTVALENDMVRGAEMLEACAMPGDATIQWRYVAARAIHHMIRMCTDYHVDGSASQGADGAMHFHVAESWLPFPPKNVLKSSNDCDGGGLFAMRIGYQGGLSPFGDSRYDENGQFNSYDPDYDPSVHVWTTAIRNALAYSDTLVFSIVGASSGEGTKVKHENGQADSEERNAAGHAVPLLLPSAMLIEALGRGDTAMDSASSDAMRAARFDVLYPTGKLRSIPESYRTHFESTTHRREYERKHSIRPLALDSTVSSEMRLHFDPVDQKRYKRLALQEVAAATKLGPVMASRMVDLTSIGPKGRHAFYLEWVEGTIPCAFGDSKLLRSSNQGSYQFVFVPLESNGNPIEGTAGVTPKDIAAGNFAMVPLQRFNSAQGASFDRVRAETKLHTMPARRFDAIANEIDSSERENMAKCIECMLDLNSTLKARGKTYGGNLPSGAFVELHITPRMFWGNPKSVQYTAQQVAKMALHGQVDVHYMPTLAPEAAIAIITIIA